ncbi:MAG: PD-(D/E)XK nuclease family protein, partial [Polyangia bacterium]
PDPSAELTHRAKVAHRALQLARKRLVIARPLTQLGQATAPHALVDEIAARLGGESKTLARITRTARDVMTESRSPALPTLELPAPRHEWKLPGRLIDPRESLSPSTIETLIGCPLRFVLEKEAGLRDASVVSLPHDSNLFGSLGHRLVECLHEQGRLGHGTKRNADALRVAARDTLDQLLREEATVLLVPGRSNDLAQLRVQLVDSVLTLDDMLRRGKLTVVSVEQEITVEWSAKRKLNGRLDLLLEDTKGRDVVLDLKWGSTSYGKKLEEGVAVQLAAYALVRKKQTGAKTLPSAGYFSLRKGEAMALTDDVFPDAHVHEGPDLDETWRRTEKSIAAIESDLASGRLAVPGMKDGKPAWRSDARMGDDAERYLPLGMTAACEYCAHDAVCGRRWTLADGGDQ